MAREPWLCQVIFTMDSNNPADAVVNTWHFNVEAGTIDPWTAVEPRLNTFYQAFDAYYSQKAGGRAPLTKWYNLADAKPRVPHREGALGTTITGGADNAPSELAVCLSYKAAFISGTPKARRRGRIYLGPWSRSIPDTDGRLDVTVHGAITTAAGVFMAAMAADANNDWIVYSTVDQAGHEVIGGWVDNAWDIQRRRGELSTSRLTF